MAAHWIDAVERFLGACETLQEQHAALLLRKGAALAGADPPALLALAEEETGLVERLRNLLATRTRILQQAAKDGRPAKSLRHLVDAAGEPVAPDLRARLLRASDRARAQRRESWVQWIVAHRSQAHFAHLVELVAHGGRSAPVYRAVGSVPGNGGALLDASI